MPARQPDEPRQLPLDLGHRAAVSRDDLVVSPANRDALALVERWPHWPSPVVVLAGPPGAGKSHLASIWRERAGAVVVPASGGGAASRPGGRPALMEDADSLSLDQTALFHLINDIRSESGHLLLTARRFPTAWPVTLPDLASRLKAATTVEIHEPDDALLAAVIAKLFADRQVQVEPSVIQFLVRRMERSLATANAVVAALDRTALERQAPVTRVLASEVLAALEMGRSSQDDSD